jgi:flagellin
MVVQHNITSMNANRQLGIVGGNVAKATEKLASGYRVNKAADDAAGLSISEKMRSQVRGLTRASDNAQDGISAIQTAEGALDVQHQILQRTRELVVQAANSAVLDVSSGDFQKIQEEINQLASEFNRVNTTTQFNKKNLLDGSYKSQYLQVGANAAQGITISISKTSWKKIDVTADTKSVKGLDETGNEIDRKVGLGSKISQQIKLVDSMINIVSEKRSKLGAQQNRLEYTIKVDDNTAENLQAAESRIRDTDMAEEMTRFSKENILQQAATSMLAQANQANQGVLSILG